MTAKLKVTIEIVVETTKPEVVNKAADEMRQALALAVQHKSMNRDYGVEGQVVTSVRVENVK